MLWRIDLRQFAIMRTGRWTRLSPRMVTGDRGAMVRLAP